MTGYTVHTGSTQKFSMGWDHVFRGTKKSEKTEGKKAAGKKPAAARSGPKKAKKGGKRKAQ